MVRIDPAAQAARLCAGLHEALEGGAPLVIGPHPPQPGETGGAALVLTTSGSTTGTGRPVGLSAHAIRAGAAATHARLRGPGQWLLTLPADHIAGVQLLARAVVAGIDPAVRGARESLAGAIGRMRTGMPRYASLVPTQLVRALDPEAAADLEALTTLDAVLVGGAAASPAAVASARAAGVPVVLTYGMTESCGGCVYDGVPLEGAGVRTESAEGEAATRGRILLRGPMLCEGYLDEGPQPFTERDGQRWLRTHDAGSWDGRRLTVLGRLDDVIITGGVNVYPQQVERALAGLPGLVEAVVVGVPDPEWGQAVAAVVVAGPHGVSLAAVRERVRAELGGAHAPRRLVLVDELPVRGPGKVDRLAAAELAAASR